MSNIYKTIYSKIGGRPWTFITRDLWTQVEWFFQAIFYFIGVIIGLQVGWKVAILYWLAYTAGYIAGHIFWGTRHKKGQKGK